MSELAKLTSSELIQDYRNPQASTEVLLQAVKQLPSAAGELAREAWQNPLDTALHVGKTAGMGLVFGTALGYVIPGRGPAAAVLATAFTIPMVVGGYKRVNQAMLDAQHTNANINFIAHALARDTVSGGADFAIGMAGGLAGTHLGRQLAMSDTAVGRFGQKAQRLVLSAENKTMSGLRTMFGSSQAKSDSAVFHDPNTALERLSHQKLSWMERQTTLLNNRLDQFQANDPNMKMYYGSLHGHSVYSDGMGKPAEIYARAKALGLDFTAITDHSHIAARGGVKPGDPRYPGQQKVPTVAENPVYYTETIKAAGDASVKGQFAGLYGVEMGTIGKPGSKGISGVNHINILQTETFFQSVKQPRPRTFFDPIRGMFRALPEPPLEPPPVVKINDGDYKALVAHLDQVKDATGGRPVVQLNHPRYAADESPDIPAKLRGRDYGQKSFKSHKEWVDQFGKYASQMELLNGEAIQKNAAGTVSSRHIHDTDFAGYIDKGLRLSPTFGRDFHYGDPGGTKAATGILASDLDAKSLINALRARRTIATTNHENLTGSMMVNNAHPMGSVLDQRAIPDLNIKVSIGGKVAPDAEYKALLWGDSKIGDGKLAKVIQTKTMSGQELLASNKTIAFDQVQQTLGAKGAYYVEIQRIPSAAELANAARASLPELATASTVPILKHAPAPLPEGPLADPMAKFLGDRMWTAPVWSEPLAGKDHSLAVKTLIGIGSTILNP